MCTKSKTELPKPVRCGWCGYEYEKKDAVQVIVEGIMVLACPVCGVTGRNRTF